MPAQIVSEINYKPFYKLLKQELEEDADNFKELNQSLITYCTYMIRGVYKKYKTSTDYDLKKTQMRRVIYLNSMILLYKFLTYKKQILKTPSVIA